jgi:acyl-CoA synthetase (NDP forming)
VSSAVATARAIIAQARAAGSNVLDEPTAKRLLTAWGISVPRTVRIGPNEAVGPMLAGLSPPFALKLVAPGILHKSEVGGVALRLADAVAVDEARQRMLLEPALTGAAINAFLLEEMAPAGHELVIGGTRDRRFGPVVILGIGGIFVEMLEDVTFRLCPLSLPDAAEMLSELRGAAVLDGARGGISVDRGALFDTLMRLAGPDGLLTTLADDIAELDINPLIASATGVFAVDARIVLTEPAQLSSFPTVRAGVSGAQEHGSILDRFAPLFMPRNIAVLGASTSGAGPASNLIRQLDEFGFTGPIYPIHPSAEFVAGRRAYRSLAELPDPVDYAFVAIAAAAVPAALSSGAKRVRFAQVMSAGFGESVDGGARQDELAALAREVGIGVLGPNCLGTFSPRGRLTFTDGMSDRLGPVGVLSQSGGLALDTLKRGQRRGLTFSGVVTIGNCADIGAADLLEFFLADPATRVIGLYLEQAWDGRRLFELMRAGRAAKPIVLLRGGRTPRGQRAALSHTGALASDDRVWAALTRQTGTVPVDTLDQFLDALLAFELLVPRPEPTRRVALFGNGGGASVLATDFFSRHGFEVAPLNEKTLGPIRQLDLPAGSSIVNPIDIPANILRRDGGRAAAVILEAIHASGEIDAVVMHINMPVVLSYRDADILGGLIEAALTAGRRYPGAANLMLVLRSDGEPEIEARKQAYREQAQAVGIPVFHELHDAALALAALRTVETYRVKYSRS